MFNRFATSGVFWLSAALLATSVPRPACAQQDQAIAAGIQFLRGRASTRPVGESAMIALALLKSDVPFGDPALTACLTKIRSRFSSNSYTPEQTGGVDVYEAGAIAMALANLDPSERGGQLDMIAAFLIGKQKPNGGWDYSSRSFGDTSISQYAVLGLWECENSGVDVPPSVWDRAAQWYMSVQSSAGSWNYHRDQGGEPETVSMTAAGVGSLLICRRQLENYRQFQKGANPYLTPVQTGGLTTDYQVVSSPAAINAAIAKGLGWIGANFNTGNAPVFGKSKYYGLYGIERIGALADRQMIGRLDWFEKGRSHIQSTQAPGGGWSGQFGDEMNSVWALLFLTKSTAKTLKRIEVRKLGAGTLLGGRFLPSDLSTMTVAGGRIISRPMNGAVEGMLDILEDPRIQNADKAVAGMIERYHAQGPSALRPHKDRLRKMLSHRDQGVRQVAAWALGRTGDLDVVPNLIAALLDADADVAATARQGLQLISRRIDGPAAADPTNAQAKQAEAAQWNQWYDLVRPLDASGADDDEADAAKPGRPSS
ncbi:MAG: HEAT repeat domain-containing protein [Paludisphaera borealis]|uniref:HEAT repeat domain-containing protein n=1 Tax=Paludisphaera borealis TaxID=1387353 RepID=UPI002841C432|nr:HEAT repeat domain-containing protein [Paludisphaera borealis]MDR3620838.1 HEAT repeat domain-containing protein [Paludisphaera borealis]